MTAIATVRRWKGGVLAAGLSLLLAACLLMPGKFDSAMDVRTDGAFSFRYTGEMVLLPLADPKASGKEADFTPMSCHDDESGEERPCTADEIAGQKAQAEQNAAMSAKSEAEMSKMFLGGIDPKDPRSAEELATKLRRQAGWRKVTYKGEGVYDVEFAISGRLDHDFVFPTIEGFPMANAFVNASLRNDGTVRIEAPGFGGSSGGMPMSAMMGMAGDMGGTDGKAPNLPERKGTFAITTNGQILANNTDEGPKPATTGQSLAWKIDATTQSPPMALVRLTR